ncbi:Phosphatidylglycerophosphatase GEP4 mitochondrial [Spathaspora sp. JA1]|nr:Phosphatidylglycerophosphatase GEP4 mitochondrial [Spathaspora sp. JA1]
MFNVSATLNVSRLLYNPTLCLPHLCIKSFDQIPIPLVINNKDNTASTIKGIVLDKDNCFAKDHDDKVWPAYQETWTNLLGHYGKDYLLIVSNSAGTNDDINHVQAEKLERDTGVTVLRHSTKKPGCFGEIQTYFAALGVQPHEIAVVGDRLFTDMLMANMMGSYGVWVSEGVELSTKLFPSFERMVYDKLANREDPYVPPNPKGQHINLGNDNIVDTLSTIYNQRLFRNLFRVYFAFLLVQYILIYACVPLEDIENRPAICVITSVYTLVMFVINAALLPLCSSTIPTLVSLRCSFVSFVMELIGLVLNITSVIQCLNAGEMFQIEKERGHTTTIKTRVDTYIIVFHVLALTFSALATSTVFLLFVICSRALEFITDRVDRRVIKKNKKYEGSNSSLSAFVDSQKDYYLV